MRMFFTEIEVSNIPEDVVFRSSIELSTCTEGISHGSYVDVNGKTITIRRVNERNRGKAGRSKYYIIEYKEED